MRSKITLLSLVFLSAMAYVFLGYFTPRNNFYLLISLFAALFVAMYYLYRQANTDSMVKKMLWFAILVRVSLLLMIPNLSDDYFRFIWDGRLLSHGINPFVVFPEKFIATSDAIKAGLNQELYNGLNSKQYFTVYPPVLQFIFALSTKIFPDNILGSILVMRSVIILAEIGSFYIIVKLLKEFNLPLKKVLLYALNPMVIIELTGNLHFEAVLIFFLLGAIWFLVKNKLNVSAVFFGLSVATKLIPLIFLPLLIRKIGFLKSIVYGLIAGGVFLVLFIPFIEKSLFFNFFSSIDLYFRKFEFNASVYYVLRWIGIEFSGYNMIYFIGPLLFVCAFISIIAISFYRDVKSNYHFFTSMLFILGIYYLFATIVHPWYLSVLVALGLFTSYRFQMAWSGLALLSYYTYITPSYQENLVLTALEYIVVGYLMAQEVRHRRVPLFSLYNSE